MTKNTEAVHMIVVSTEVATHKFTLKRSVGMHLVFPDTGVYCSRQLMNTTHGLFGLVENIAMEAMRI